MSDGFFNLTGFEPPLAFGGTPRPSALIGASKPKFPANGDTAFPPAKYTADDDALVKMEKKEFAAAAAGDGSDDEKPAARPPPVSYLPGNEIHFFLSYIFCNRSPPAKAHRRTRLNDQRIEGKRESRRHFVS